MEPGPTSRAALVCVLAAVLAACAWDPWIPGERSWNPDVVVDPTTLSEDLPLDSLYVGRLDCYSQRCQKRFRVVADESGQLTVRVVPELSHADAQGRVVLEAVQGVLGQANSGRGPHDDVVVLAVRETVDPGVYFVLIQSLGGPMPYQVMASLTPGEGPARPTAARPAPAEAQEPPRPEGPAPRLVKVDLPGRAAAGYDPAVSFEGLRTFSFPAPVQPGADVAPGTPLEQPIDRQIRRLLADDLKLKGLRQATDGAPADLLVDFSHGATTRTYRPFFLFVYGWYQTDLTDPLFDEVVNTRGVLTVDIVDTRSNRIAWHASTTKGLGPGVTYDDQPAMLREAVSEVLARFPPR